MQYNQGQQQQQQVVDPDADLPSYKIRHNDMRLQLTKKLLEKPDLMLQKDVCLKVVEFLRANKPQFGSGQGQWQCVIGKNLAATLNYDLHMLTFFDLPEFGYSVLVFKSG